MEVVEKFIFALSDKVLNPLIVLMFGIALVVFIWGLVVFMRNSPDEKALTTAKQHVLYGLLGMFIMISAFGLIKILTTSFGIDKDDNVGKLQKK